VHYIDGLAAKQSPGTVQASGHATSLNALSLDAVFSAITAATTPPSSQTDVPPTKPTIIIDGLDLILAFQPTADVVKIQHLISQLRQSANALVLTCSADSPLLHNSHGSATPLERNHAAFLASMAHQSNWIMQLRGLNTGTAKDVTGVLRISEGGAYEEEEIAKTEVEDGECLYQLKGDGSVRLWSRGE
jgi:elongator complex protein 6